MPLGACGKKTAGAGEIATTTEEHNGSPTMNLSADLKRNELRRSRMKVTWITALLAALTIGHAFAQGVSLYVPSTPACFELYQKVITHATNGRIDQAEIALSSSLAIGPGQPEHSCAGLVLTNVAVLMAVWGRLGEAEKFAERSFDILQKIYPPNDAVLLRPLQILAAARFEQGKTARAREAFKRMQAIRIQRPEDDALVHGTAGALLSAEGRRPEAEGEYLAAIRAWQEAGRGETADVSAILNEHGSLYIHQQRLAEARQALDRAFAILTLAQDAAPLDRIKLLNLRGVLHARQGDWRQAEQDLHDALSMSDREPWVDPVAHRSLLTNYALVLRKNHHRREARSIEARAAATQTDRTTAAIVDFTDLLPKDKPAKK
jgi:tetratricopeptide (TPR) repeat protein